MPRAAATKSFNGAATGWPRNGGGLLIISPADRCFNGAATGWPRNVNRRRPSRESIDELQWGRDRMAAERRARTCSSTQATGLQWGRDRMAAERVSATAIRSSTGECFNGAATGWPRNENAIDVSRLNAKLQWGRDRMAAERGQVLIRAARPGASMGPRPDGRGTTVQVAQAALAAELQWGRDRMAAERS